MQSRQSEMIEVTGESYRDFLTRCASPYTDFPSTFVPTMEQLQAADLKFVRTPNFINDDLVPMASAAYRNIEVSSKAPRVKWEMFYAVYRITSKTAHDGAVEHTIYGELKQHVKANTEFFERIHRRAP
jgi:hypothetical protein